MKKLLIILLTLSVLDAQNIVKISIGIRKISETANRKIEDPLGLIGEVGLKTIYLSQTNISPITYFNISKTFLQDGKVKDYTYYTGIDTDIRTAGLEFSNYNLEGLCGLSFIKNNITIDFLAGINRQALHRDYSFWLHSDHHAAHATDFKYGINASYNYDDFVFAFGFFAKRNLTYSKDEYNLKGGLASTGSMKSPITDPNLIYFKGMKKQRNEGYLALAYNDNGGTLGIKYTFANDLIQKDRYFSLFIDLPLDFFDLSKMNYSF